MKFNKWTVALAAVGAISLASAAKAEEKLSPVNSTVSGTTISGWVSTSAEWNFGTGNMFVPPYKFNSPSKADGFNLDVVQIRIEKDIMTDTDDWAAGYRVDLWAGPDANALGTSSALFSSSTSDFAIRQAYVALKAPVLPNALFVKAGVFDSIIGYESLDATANPNFTRSYGATIEPQTHTGVLLTYVLAKDVALCKEFDVAFGVANTMGPSINSRAQDGSSDVMSGFLGRFNPLLPPGVGNPIITAGDNAKAESYKTYMGSVRIVAPDSMGFLAGSKLYGGLVNGFNNSVLGTGAGLPQYNAYAGVLIPTPWNKLTVGFAFDEMDIDTVFASGPRVNASAWSVAGYASLKATEKLSFHARMEYLDARIDEPVDAHADIMATTLTAQYDLWKNVISRVEFRWDRSLDVKVGGSTFNNMEIFGGSIGTGPDRRNAFLLAANLIYSF